MNSKTDWSRAIACALHSASRDARRSVDKTACERSSIINIGSVASRITPPGSSVYSGTKGAVDAITGVLSRELGPKKIRVNALNPGMVETEGTHSAGVIGSDFETGTIAQTPLGRVGQAGDIASIAVFLASDDSAWLTGEQILASGGLRQSPLTGFLPCRKNEETPG